MGTLFLPGWRFAEIDSPQPIGFNLPSLQREFKNWSFQQNKKLRLVDVYFQE